jgi:hypothetical protein
MRAGRTFAEYGFVGIAGLCVAIAQVLFVAMLQEPFPQALLTALMVLASLGACFTSFYAASAISFTRRRRLPPPPPRRTGSRPILYVVERT